MILFESVLIGCFFRNNNMGSAVDRGYVSV